MYVYIYVYMICICNIISDIIYVMYIYVYKETKAPETHSRLARDLLREKQHMRRRPMRQKLTQG